MANLKAPIAITLRLLPILTPLALVSACQGDTDSGISQVSVCQDNATHVRLHDSECDNGDDGNTWVYYAIGTQVPAIGSSTNGASTKSDPNASSIIKGFSAQGGEAEEEQDDEHAGGNANNGGGNNDDGNEENQGGNAGGGEDDDDEGGAGAGAGGGGAGAAAEEDED